MVCSDLLLLLVFHQDCLEAFEFSLVEQTSDNFIVVCRVAAFRDDLLQAADAAADNFVVVLVLIYGLKQQDLKTGVSLSDKSNGFCVAKHAL